MLLENNSDGLCLYSKKTGRDAGSRSIYEYYRSGPPYWTSSTTTE